MRHLWVEGTERAAPPLASVSAWYCVVAQAVYTWAARVCVTYDPPPPPSQLERRLLSKCLLYALFINQRVAPAVVAELLDLLHGIVIKAQRTGVCGGGDMRESVRGGGNYLTLGGMTPHPYARLIASRPAGSKDAFLGEQSQLVLLSCALALTPQEERGAQERSQLRALAGSTLLRDKILPPGRRVRVQREGEDAGCLSLPHSTPCSSGSRPLRPFRSAAPLPGSAPHPLLRPHPHPSVGQAAGPYAVADGPSAVLHLSWGLLQCLLHQQGGGGGGAGGQPQQHPQAGEEARKPLLEGAAAGAFAYLRQVRGGG